MMDTAMEGGSKDGDASLAGAWMVGWERRTMEISTLNW